MVGQIENLIFYSNMTHGGKREGAGRKKGSKATHTLEAQAVKELYVEKAKEYALPILEALVEKALEGDVRAIKEFNDRAYGKAPQALTGAEGGQLVIKIAKEVGDRYELHESSSVPEDNSQGQA